MTTLLLWIAAQDFSDAYSRLADSDPAVHGPAEEELVRGGVAALRHIRALEEVGCLREPGHDERIRRVIRRIEESRYSGGAITWTRAAWTAANGITVTDSVSIDSDGVVTIRTVNPACEMATIEPFRMTAEARSRLLDLLIASRMLDLDREDFTPMDVPDVMPTATRETTIEFAPAEGDVARTRRHAFDPSGNDVLEGWPGELENILAGIHADPDGVRE